MSFDSGQLLILEDGVLTDRTALIHDDSSFTFDVTRGRRGTASVPLMLYADDVYLPKIGWPVWIYEVYQGSPVTTQAVFVGVISEFQFAYFNDQGDRVVTLTVVTLEKYFDSIPTPAADYKGMTAGAIFTAIFNSVIGQLPSAPVITLGTVDAGVSISERVYNGTSNSAQDFQQLATDSAYIWYIDPRDLKVYFHSSSTRPAAFTVISEDIYVEEGKSSIQWSVSDTDFRSSQVIQMAPSTVPSLVTLFPGDGTTTVYTLPQLYSGITGAFLSTGTQGQSALTVSGTPSNGDTLIIGPAAPASVIIYTLVSALDNTVPLQILISSTPAVMAQRIVDAINCEPSTRGTSYSTPTTPAQVARAAAPVGATVALIAATVGPSSTLVGQVSTALSWSDPTLAGGIISGTVGLSGGVINTGTYQLYYSPNSDTISLAEPVPDGVTLTVTYLAVAPGQLGTGSDAATSFGVAPQFRQIAARGAVTPADASQQAAAVLAAYSVLPLPKVFSFQSDTPGLFCGDWVAVLLTVPPQAAAVLNGNWLVQGVHGDWIAGFELNEPPFACHFRYTYTLINTTEISTYQDTLLALIDTGPFLPAGSDSSKSVAPPAATTSPTDGSGGSGDTMTPAQAWVQEQLGFAVLQAGNDLVMASSSTVSSASYSFTSDDVGRSIPIVPATGWTPGSYPITSVIAGVATITGAPAISGTTGGLWGITDPHVYQFTWAPGVSFWTHNPIAIVIKLTSNGDSPLTFKSQQLTPFAYAEVGYSITPISASGPDYTIAGDQLTLRDALADGDFLITEYFPDKPVKLPHKKAGDAPPRTPLFVVAKDDAAAAGKTIMTSPDAVTWTEQTTPINILGTTVAFGAGVYVMGAEFNSGPNIATSTDAITWTAQSSPADNHRVIHIIYGGGQFVALLSSTSVPLMTSPDGITWTAQTATKPGGQPWTVIAYSPDLALYAAINDSGNVMTSPDAVTWTLLDGDGPGEPFPNAAGMACMAWGAGQFVALGGLFGSGALFTSVDGVSWTATFSPGGYDAPLQTIAFGGGAFAALGDDISPSTQQGAKSSDGTTWSIAPCQVGNWDDMTFGAGLYVACDADDTGTHLICSSSDGVTWTLQTTPSVQFCGGICYG